MLSVRRRQEDAGGRVVAAQTQQLRGGLGMDDDAELEEGDPDVALSYIERLRERGDMNVVYLIKFWPSLGLLQLERKSQDEKLQDVLGHFQKDFGGVSAEKKIKPESKYNASNFEGSNVINERGPAVSRSMGKVSGKETLPYDTNGENNSKNEVKKKMQREQKTNASRSSDFLEDEKHVDSSAAVKERKSDMQSKSSHTGKKPKTKSHRDVRDNLPEGSYGSKERDTLENGSALGDPRPKEKPWKYDSERDSDAPGILRREISSSVKHDKHLASEEQKMHIPPPSTVSSANAAPVVIEEHWVCCDIIN